MLQRTNWCVAAIVNVIDRRMTMLQRIDLTLKRADALHQRCNQQSLLLPHFALMRQLTDQDHLVNVSTKVRSAVLKLGKHRLSLLHSQQGGHSAAGSQDLVFRHCTRCTEEENAG